VSDPANKLTHADRRRKQAQDALRQRLRAGQYLNHLHKIAEAADTCEPAAVPALRLKADIYMKILAKCLPDLKAVEHSGTVNHVNYDAAILGLLNERGTEAGDAEGAPHALN
jgi:hypothetical protein